MRTLIVFLAAGLYAFAVIGGSMWLSVIATTEFP